MGGYAVRSRCVLTYLVFYPQTDGFAIGWYIFEPLPLRVAVFHVRKVKILIESGIIRP